MASREEPGSALGTPPWLKTPRAVGSPLAMRPLGDLTSATANAKTADATPMWLKRAARVQEEADPPFDTVALSTACAPKRTQLNLVVPHAVAVVCRGDFKIGAVRLRNADLASLRRDLQRELPQQLRRLFPRGWRFSLPEGDVPVARAQEQTWLCEEIAHTVDGRPHIALMDDPEPPSVGAVLHESLRSLTAHALTAATGVASLAKWQELQRAPVTARLLRTCAPNFLARGSKRTEALGRAASSPLPPPKSSTRPAAGGEA